MKQCHCKSYTIYISPAGACATVLGQFWNCSSLLVTCSSFLFNIWLTSDCICFVCRNPSHFNTINESSESLEASYLLAFNLRQLLVNLHLLIYYKSSVRNTLLGRKKKGRTFVKTCFEAVEEYKEEYWNR